LGKERQIRRHEDGTDERLAPDEVKAEMLAFIRRWKLWNISCGF
jgi:hypothetical protein